MAILGLLLSIASPQTDALSLISTSNQAKKFDAGITLFDPQGTLLSAFGHKEAWESWIVNASSWQFLYKKLANQTSTVIINRDYENGTMYGLISEDISGGDLIIGAFSINALAETTQIGRASCRER